MKPGDLVECIVNWEGEEVAYAHAIVNEVYKLTALITYVGDGDPRFFRRTMVRMQTQAELRSLRVIE